MNGKFNAEDILIERFVVFVDVVDIIVVIDQLQTVGFLSQLDEDVVIEDYY